MAAALSADGWASLCGGRLDEALAKFSKAIALDPGCAEAFNHRSIGHRIAGQDALAAADEAMVEELTKDDQREKFRQQRKWMCVGFDVRGEPKGEKFAAEADFLISFASPDRVENNRILEELRRGVHYHGEIRRSVEYERLTNINSRPIWGRFIQPIFTHLWENLGNGL